MNCNRIFTRIEQIIRSEESVLNAPPTSTTGGQQTPAVSSKSSKLHTAGTGIQTDNFDESL
jgi:hypothetical protein